MKKRLFAVLCLCMAVLLLGGCGSIPQTSKNYFNTEYNSDYDETENSSGDTLDNQEESNKENGDKAESSNISDKKEKKTKKKTGDYTLEQKVGQLFIVRPDALDFSIPLGDIENADADGVTSVTSAVESTIEKYYVGGVCQFSKNILNPDQLKKFNNALQTASEIPMFITVDEEGGIVARLANNSSFGLPKYKSAASVGASGNSNDAKKMGKTIGGYLKDYGFNMDFAPDADVNTNPNNPIIGSRAFSSDAKIAASMVGAAAEGFRESGILPTLKHFPGHGDTAEDSHSLLAVTHKSLDELKSCEFLPFKADSGMHCVMVGHIAAPKVTGNNTPASLSKTLVDMIPDKDNTLIITDSLSMKAISDAYSSGEAAVAAFEAGCDILLMPEDFKAAYNGILEAVKSGRISEERLNESIIKIKRYKNEFVDGFGA